MKSEHRHDLQTNELSKWVTRLQTKLTPIIEDHGTKIIFGALFLAVVILFGRIYAGRLYQADAGSWQEVQHAALSEMQGVPSADDEFDVFDLYYDVAEHKDYADSPAASWAKLKGAETQLAEGIQDMFRNRGIAISSLEEARDEFQYLSDPENKADKRIRERALFGLARSKETLSTGDLKAATTAYQKLLDDFPDSVYHEAVTKRIADLKTGDSMAFYAWFSKKSPEPAEQGKPDDGGLKRLFGDGIPSSDNDLNPPPTNVTPESEGTEPTEKESTEDAGDNPEEKTDDKEKATEEKTTEKKVEAPADETKEDGKPEAAPEAAEDKETPEDDDAADSDTETADKKTSDGK